MDNTDVKFSAERGEDTPNADTLSAIEEVQTLKRDPDKKIYHSFSEVLEELDIQ